MTAGLAPRTAAPFPLCSECSTLPEHAVLQIHIVRLVKGSLIG